MMQWAGTAATVAAAAPNLAEPVKKSRRLISKFMVIPLSKPALHNARAAERDAVTEIQRTPLTTNPHRR